MTMRKKTWILSLFFIPGLLLTFPSAVAPKQLTRKQAEELVLNVPDAAASKARGGCPKASLLWIDDEQATIFFAIHNPCDKSGSASDKVGNFMVDLRNGEVWGDVERYDDGS